MLKYKYKRHLQTNSWINTIINNYNKIYEDSEEEQNMKFEEQNQIITYIDLLNFSSFDIKKFLLNYNFNKKLLNRIKELKIKKWIRKKDILIYIILKKKNWY